MTNKILLINGPNLNMLGKRQTHIYGNETLEDIVNFLKKESTLYNIEIEDFQNNIEGEVVNFLNNQYLEFSNAKNLSKNKIAGIIINPAAYSHTSVAIRDALEVFKGENIPIFEVHISNIYSREEFRHHSYMSAISTGVITGFGTFGYLAALKKIIELGKYVRGNS